MYAWNLSTQDTAVALEIKNGQPCIVFLGQPGKKNFARRPACVRLPRRYIADQNKIIPKWEFICANEGESGEAKYAELCFRDAVGGLEARSRWETYDGPGAVTHQLRLDNKTGYSAIIYQPESLDITLGADEPMEVTFVRACPEPLCDRYTADLWANPDGGDTGFIPLAALRAAGMYGVYIGLARNHGRIAIRGVEQGDGIAAKIKAGLYDDFCTAVNPGESFEVPMAFIGAYTGDIDGVLSRLDNRIQYNL